MSSLSAAARRRLAPVLALAALLALAGCGGPGPGGSGRAGALVTIAWPRAAARMIPAGAGSITVSFTRDGTTLASQTAVRPETAATSTLTFTTLPLGTLSVRADAHPNYDGTGNTQATGTSTVPIVAGQVTPVAISLASTVDHLTLTPGSPTVAAGATTQLVAAAMDAGGTIVLVAPSAITWASAATGVATVNAAGVVTGVSAGSAVITVSDNESGKSASVTVTVTG